MGQFTVYEIVGHAEYIKLRDLTGATTSKEVREAKSADIQHRFSDCVLMTRCPIHGAQFRQSTKEFRAAHRKAHPLPKRPKAAKVAA